MMNKIGLGLAILVLVGSSLMAASATAPLCTDKPNIDGKLSDDVWNKLPWNSNFTVLGTPSEKASPQTRFKLMRDKQFLYFAIECDEPTPEKMKIRSRNIPDSNKLWKDESIEIHLSPSGRLDQYYQILANSAGTYFDGYFQDDNTGKEKYNQQGDWDSGAVIATSKDKNKWMMEVALPLGSLNLGKDTPNKWLFNIGRSRYIDKKAKHHSVFSAIDRGRFGTPRCFATLSLPKLDVSPFQWMISVSKAKTIKLDGKLFLDLKASIINQTGRLNRIKLFATIVDSKGEVKKDFKVLRLRNKQEIKVDFKLPVINSGNGDVFLSIERDAQPGIELKKASVSVNLEFVPIKMVLKSPAYRNNIYASQDLKEIVLELNIDEEFITSPVTVSLQLVGKKIQTKVAPSGSVKRKLSFDAASLSVGDYMLKAVIEKNSKIVSKSILLRKLPAFDGEVWLNADGITHINGKSFLPYGLFSGPKKTIEGYNIVQTYRIFFKKEDMKKYLDDAHAGGYKVVVYPYQEFNGAWKRKYTDLHKHVFGRLTDKQREIISDCVNTFKRHPALLAWYLADEPENVDGSVEWFRDVYELVKELDPYHPAIMLNWGIPGIRKYHECCDILMPDCYPVFKKDRKTEKVRWCTTEWVKAARDYKPTWLVPQGFHWGKKSAPDEVDPSFEDLRNQMYQAYIAGAKGLLWFSYEFWHLPYFGMRYGLPWLGRESQVLKDGILAPNQPELVAANISPAGKHVYYASKQVAGKFYLFVVNCENQAVKTAFRVKQDHLEQLHVVGETRSLELQAKMFSEMLPAYDARVYVSDEKIANAVNLSEIRTKIARAENARLKPGNILGFGAKFKHDYLRWKKTPPKNRPVIKASSTNRRYHVRNVASEYFLFDGLDLPHETWTAWRPSGNDKTPWIQIDLPKKEMIGKVVLAAVMPEDGSAPRLSDYAIQIRENGKFTTVANVEDTRMHRSKAIFTPVETDGIKIIFNKLRKANSPVITEIEAYAE